MKRFIPHIICKRRVVTLKVFPALLYLLFYWPAQAQKSPEYNVKAAFIYNFTQFVEWPESAFATAESPFIIGILGDDPFGASIDETVAGQKAKGRPITIQRFRNVKEIAVSHILFVSNSEKVKLKETMAGIPGKNTLTVSDIEDFATSGGIIRFITKEDKIELQINLNASKAAALNISSKLLKVAEIIN